MSEVGVTVGERGGCEVVSEVGVTVGERGGCDSG